MPFHSLWKIADISLQWCREMPDPVIPVTFYKEFSEVENSGDPINNLVSLVKRLPEPNRYVFV